VIAKFAASGDQQKNGLDEIERDSPLIELNGDLTIITAGTGGSVR
jgi:hypothetical protein